MQIVTNIVTRLEGYLYRFFYTPKTFNNLGFLVKNYKKEFFSPISSALKKELISPDVLMELSVIYRNHDTLSLALDFNASIDTLAPPFGMPINRRRRAPFLHALFDNNIDFFSLVAKKTPEKLNKKVICRLLKEFAKNSGSSVTAKNILQVLIASPHIHISPKQLYNLAIQKQCITLETFILNLESVNRLLDPEFIMENIDNELHLCSDNMASILLHRLSKTPTLQYQRKLDFLLYRSAKSGRASICKILIKQGANTCSKHLDSTSKQYALSAALLQGHAETALLLLNKKTEFWYNGQQRHVLVDAIKGGSAMEKIIPIITKEDSIPNDILSKALYFAADKKQIMSHEIYALLLNSGADPLFSHADFFNGTNAVFVSILRGNLTLFDVFIKHLKNSGTNNTDPKLLAQCIFLAFIDPRFNSSKDNEQYIADIIKKDAVFFSQQEIDEALISVAKKGRQLACELFLSMGSNPNYLSTLKTYNNISAPNRITSSLIEAVKEEQYDTAQTLVNNGAFVSRSLFSELEIMGEQRDIYGLRFLVQAGGIIPFSLSNEDALIMTGCETWTEVLDTLKEAQGYLLSYILPRYYEHLNITPLDYIQQCPQWHKYYVTTTLSNF